MNGWCEGIAFSPNGRVWIFPDTHLIFTKSIGNTATIEDVNGLFDWFAWLERDATIVSRDAPPVVVHDWRSFETVPPDVRAVFTQRRKQIATTPERIVVALAINPVLRMALRTVALGSQLLTHAVPLEFVDDPEPEIARHGTPDPVLHLRLREEWRART